MTTQAIRIIYSQRELTVEKFCLPSPFKIHSSTISRYINGITGNIFTSVSPTRGSLRQMTFPISFPTHKKIPLMKKEYMNELVRALVTRLFIRSELPLEFARAISGIRTFEREVSIAVGKNSVGIIIASNIPYSLIPRSAEELNLTSAIGTSRSLAVDKII